MMITVTVNYQSDIRVRVMMITVTVNYQSDIRVRVMVRMRTALLTVPAVSARSSRSAPVADTSASCFQNPRSL